MVSHTARKRHGRPHQSGRHIAIVTFDGFNEIDSIVAAHILNRVPTCTAEIVCPTETVTSMNGLVVSAQKPLTFASEADAVIIGSGRKTREHVKNPAIMDALSLDPRRQLIGSQCSGALVLMHLGLLREGPVCTDARTKADVIAAGLEVLEAPFHADGNMATAGGCLASHYLAAWLIWRRAGREAAFDALSYVLPRGHEAEYLRRVVATVGPFIDPSQVLKEASPRFRPTGEIT